jgi:hypothetical protein
MTKIYIICAIGIYHYIEDYVLSFKNEYMEIILFNEIKDIPPLTHSNIYVFIQSFSDQLLSTIDNTYHNIYLLNIEQLSISCRINYIHSLPKNIKILDYSRANMMYHTDYSKKFLPYQINYDEIYNFPKERDICIMATESPRRNHIINDLIQRGYNIDIISGWRKERDERLFRYKILINISYNSGYKIYEALRCDRCIYNKMIVISEKKEGMDLYNLKDYMIFEDYETIVNKAIDVLHNYELNYKTLQLDTLNLETLPRESITPEWFS